MRLPCPAGQLTDRGAGLGIAHDDELPRLAVLRARCVGRCFEELRELGVVHLDVAERATRALAVHNLEEVFHQESDAPTRAKEFTYMMRRLGPRAQLRNSGVSVAPMRSMT